MRLYQNRDWLYQKYWIEELSTTEIAKICGTSHSVIQYWLRKHNIQLRSLSESTTLTFKKGRKAPLEGKHHSEKARDKISNKAKERFKCKENHPMYGKHHSMETRKKNSDAHKGKEVIERQKLTIDDEQKLRQLYDTDKGNNNIPEVANILGIGRNAVYNGLVRCNIERRSVREANNWPDKIEISCDNCGKLIERLPCKINKTNFCDENCYNEFKKTLTGDKNGHWDKDKIDIYCDWCGDPISLVQRGYDTSVFHFCKGKSDNNNLVSKASKENCWAKFQLANGFLKEGKDNPHWNGGKVEVKCSICGKLKMVNPCQLKMHKEFYCGEGECRGKFLSKINSGENNYNWQGGISNEPYAFEFNRSLKEMIKERDNYTCQLCGNKKYLVVHHIDYEKENSNEGNLITLCNICNSKVNYDREYWTKHFRDKIRNDEFDFKFNKLMDIYDKTEELIKEQNILISRFEVVKSK